MTAVQDDPPSVDIVIPVHGGLHFTIDCLQSVFLHTSGRYRVIVVDDASPSGVADQLNRVLSRTWPEQSTLLRNPRNLGFVETVNRGVAAGDGDMVALLNSDVIVTPGWLEGMIAALRSSDDIGIVTPLSNHAHLTRVDIPWGAPPNQIAAAVRFLSLRRYPEIGIGSAFCLLTPRALWEELNGFDVLFSPGYFEEADYCMRAKARGFRTIADDATYVHHHGWGSFGPEQRTDRMERNARLFEARWGPAQHQWTESVEQAQPFERLIEQVAESVPAPGGTVVATAFRGAAEAARTREPGYRRPPPRIPAATSSMAVDHDEHGPRIGFVVANIHRDAVTADRLRLADALLLAGGHATVASPGKVDVRVFADPISLRPFLGTERDLVDRLPPHDVWIAADHESADLVRRLCWRDQVPAWLLQPDLRREGAITWGNDQETGMATMRIPVWVDSCAFGSRRQPSTVVVPIPPGTRPADVELTRRVLATLAPTDVILHGDAPPDSLAESSIATYAGHLSIAEEVELLSRASWVVGTLAGPASHPGMARAHAAGVPVIAEEARAPDPAAVVTPDVDNLDDAKGRHRAMIHGLRWAQRHDVRQIAANLAASLPRARSPA